MVIYSITFHTAFQYKNQVITSNKLSVDLVVKNRSRQEYVIIFKVISLSNCEWKWFRTIRSAKMSRSLRALFREVTKHTTIQASAEMGEPAGRTTIPAVVHQLLMVECLDRSHFRLLSSRERKTCQSWGKDECSQTRGGSCNKTFSRVHLIWGRGDSSFSAQQWPEEYSLEYGRMVLGQVSDQSSALKPIEHLRRDLKMSVHRRFPSNLTKLERIWQEEWDTPLISAKEASIKYWLWNILFNYTWTHITPILTYLP